MLQLIIIKRLKEGTLGNLHVLSGYANNHNYHFESKQHFC
jgi:hypothetical protein